MGSSDVTIGILGGMGPEATIDLMRRVVAMTPARDDQDHIRMLVDHNPKVPSRIKALIEKTGESPAPALIGMAQRLEQAGASILALPCNTAHAYAGEITPKVGIPLLDMIALAAKRIHGMTPPPRSVGMLASTAVRTLGLYERALGPLGISTIYPVDQDAVMDIIKAVKRGESGGQQRQALQRAAEDVRRQGAEMLLVACTELSVLADCLDRHFPVLDALDVLAETIVACGLGSCDGNSVRGQTS
jgi:aspartate racemase